MNKLNFVKAVVTLLLFAGTGYSQNDDHDDHQKLYVDFINEKETTIQQARKTLFKIINQFICKKEITCFDHVKVSIYFLNEAGDHYEKGVANTLNHHGKFKYYTFNNSNYEKIYEETYDEAIRQLENE